MTDKKLKGTDEELKEKYLWKEGDLKYIGNRKLTPEEETIVENYEKEEANE